MPAPLPIRYEIIDGVRRAKVFSRFGITTIRAVVEGTTDEIDVPVDELGSPHKDVIDTTIFGGSFRLNRIVNAVANGQAHRLPPIRIRPGSRAPHIRDVRII